MGAGILRIVYLYVDIYFLDATRHYSAVTNASPQRGGGRKRERVEAEGSGIVFRSGRTPWNENLNLARNFATPVREDGLPI
jgi:hypothetical protein